MFAHLLKILIVMELFFLQNVYADIKIIDGDTIIFNEKKIRLLGIDAPETNQYCFDKKKIKYSCGLNSTKALIQFIKKNRNKSIKCIHHEIDKYGRFISECWTGEISINSWLVKNGFALAYLQYSDKFFYDEKKAKEKRLGVWQGRFIYPWDWRRGERFKNNNNLDKKECYIKGNISSKGQKIYHIPGNLNYEKTKINENKGERWFCSEEEAKMNGWRKSKK